jgi:formiminotetrahydrofolate cyclodeaminase
MEINKLPQTEEEVDVRIAETQKQLKEIMKSPEYNPKNAKDFELLEKRLQSLAREQADLIAAKKNMQFVRE